MFTLSKNLSVKILFFQNFQFFVRKFFLENSVCEKRFHSHFINTKNFLHRSNGLPYYFRRYQKPQSVVVSKRQGRIVKNVSTYQHFSWAIASCVSPTNQIIICTS